jgi:hypothetical protein
MDLISEYNNGLDCIAVFTAPPVFGELLPGQSNLCQPRLHLNMPEEDIIPIFITSNIYIGLYLPKALTLTLLQPYKIYYILQII